MTNTKNMTKYDKYDRVAALEVVLRLQMLGLVEVSV